MLGVSVASQVSYLWDLNAGSYPRCHQYQSKSLDTLEIERHRIYPSSQMPQGISTSETKPGRRKKMKELIKWSAQSCNISMDGNTLSKRRFCTHQGSWCFCYYVIWSREAKRSSTAKEIAGRESRMPRHNGEWTRKLTEGVRCSASPHIQTRCSLTQSKD